MGTVTHKDSSAWLKSLADKYRSHLDRDIIPHWLKHAPDREHGGYFTCFDRRWNLYDDRKYMWMQGRLVWMFSRLYNRWERRPEYLEAASVGVPLIRDAGRDEKGRIFFSLTRDGRPLHYQRKPFAAVFCQMGMLEYFRATGDESCRREAELLFDKILAWIADPVTLGHPQTDGPSFSSLAHVMVVACMALEMADAFPDELRYRTIIRDSIPSILRHLDPEKGVLMENAPLDICSSTLAREWPEIRFFNPGHSIEVAWFLLHLLEHFPDNEIEKTALTVIGNSFEIGWDREFGGFYNFMDLEGRPCLQPEAEMKYFWPINEAIYACTLAWFKTNDQVWLDRLELADRYAFDRLVDKEHGGWFGYLDRRGNLALDCKGGNYMSFFHVPRSLMMTVQLIEDVKLTRV